MSVMDFLRILKVRDLEIPDDHPGGMALVVTGSLLVLGVGVLLSQHGRHFGKKKKKKKKKKNGLDTGEV